MQNGVIRLSRLYYSASMNPSRVLGSGEQTAPNVKAFDTMEKGGSGVLEAV